MISSYSRNSRKQVTDRPYNVLFLSSRNSARSIIAEALLNGLGAGKFKVYSAGTNPKGEVNPYSIGFLRGLGYETSGLRSKSWEEFAKPSSPEFDFIFTVCDDAAGEEIPVWPGKPTNGHWGIPDPVTVKGSPPQIALAFNQACRMISQRIGVFAALLIAKLDEVSLRAKEIRRRDDVTAKVEAA